MDKNDAIATCTGGFGGNGNTIKIDHLISYHKQSLGAM
jgi:hypothetical protein